jgi:hypothetical protein
MKLSKRDEDRLAKLEARAEKIEGMDEDLEKERKALKREVRSLARSNLPRTRIMEAAKISRRWLYNLIGENAR